MGVIIGAGTTVSIAGGGHPTQVSWNVNPNIQRAYILGDWNPYTGGEVKSPTETLNFVLGHMKMFSTVILVQGIKKYLHELDRVRDYF